MTITTPTEITEQTIATNYADEDIADSTDGDVLQRLLDARSLSAADVRMLMSAAIEADRAQRTGRRVLTVPDSGWRVGVSEPHEVYTAIKDMLETGYPLDEIEWDD